MSFPAPPSQPPDSFDSSEPPPAKRGWPGAAKVVVAVLAATTIAAVVAGVVLTSSAKGDTSDVQNELESTQEELESVNEELDSSQSELESSQSELQRTQADLASAQEAASTTQEQLTSTQTELEGTQSDLAATQAEADALRGLFPFGFGNLADAPLQGTYTLALIGAGECTGYADNASACSADSLPNSIDILGDPAFGYTVSSSFFADTPLVEDAGRFTASGQVVASAADLCDGQVSTTSFSLSLTVAEVGLTNTITLQPTLLFVDYTMATEATAGCTATARNVDFDGSRV